MKRLFFFLFLVTCVTCMFSQEIKYSYSKYYVTINVIGEPFPVGKNQVEGAFKREYLEKTFKGIPRKCLNEQQQEVLNHNGVGARIFVNNKGYIFRISFSCPKKVFPELSEDVFRKLYNAYREVKVDLEENVFKDSIFFGEQNYVAFTIRVQ